MPTQEEIDKVMEWCEEIKKRKGRSSAIERNPFGHMKWMQKFALIYIDMGKENVPKSCLVYDSERRTLWQCIGNEWVPVLPDLGKRK